MKELLNIETKILREDIAKAIQSAVDRFQTKTGILVTGIEADFVEEYVLGGDRVNHFTGLTISTELPNSD